MRTFKVTLTEEELKAVINHNIFNVFDYSSERSSRIHELTKKLNKNIETEDKAEEQESCDEYHQRCEDCACEPAKLANDTFCEHNQQDCHNTCCC